MDKKRLSIDFKIGFIIRSNIKVYNMHIIWYSILKFHKKLKNIYKLKHLHKWINILLYGLEKDQSTQAILS